MASAIGCADRRSTAAASATTDATPAPFSGTTSTTSGTPCVNVPVLSNATHLTALVRSRCTPPLISTPLRAAPASAATTDTGVEMTSAHGQETTSRTSARYIHACQLTWKASGGTIATTTARAMTAGV